MNLHLCWPRVTRQALRVKAFATVGNFYILQKPSVHSGVMLRWQREMPRPGKSEEVVAAVDNFDLSGLSEAASRIENLISWNDTDHQIIEYEDDDDEFYEDDVDWYTGDCDDEWMKPHTQLVVQQVHPHLHCVHQQVAVFKKHVSFCHVSRVPEAIFLLLNIGAFDGLAQPSWHGQEGQEERKVLFAQRWEVAKPWYTFHFAKTTDLTC